MDLTKDSLFAVVPRQVPSVDVGYVYERIATAEYADLLSYTYLLIKAATDAGDILKLWHIRLRLHMLNGDTASARTEAITINNALYLMENSTTVNEGTILPLPRNSDIVYYELLITLLRLKSVPNLALINEYYKLCYQIRLKDTRDDELKVKLTNLSYDIFVVLLLNHEYTTLYSTITVTIEQMEGGYETDVQVLKVLVAVLSVLISPNTKQVEIFDTVSQPVKNAWAIAGALTTLESLKQSIVEKRVTAKTLVSFLGVWNLVNSSGFAMADTLVAPEPRETAQPLIDDLLALLACRYTPQSVYPL